MDRGGGERSLTGRLPDFSRVHSKVTVLVVVFS